MELNQHKCKPCKKGEPPLTSDAVAEYLSQIQGWHVSSTNDAIDKIFSFPNFAKALDFVNRIGAIAEEEGHHPDILLSWGKVKVSLSTHKIHGLSPNDFILASKIDSLNL